MKILMLLTGISGGSVLGLVCSFNEIPIGWNFIMGCLAIVLIYSCGYLFGKYGW